MGLDGRTLGPHHGAADLPADPGQKHDPAKVTTCRAAIIHVPALLVPGRRPALAEGRGCGHARTQRGQRRFRKGGYAGLRLSASGRRVGPFPVVRYRLNGASPPCSVYPGKWEESQAKMYVATAALNRIIDPPALPSGDD